MPYPSLEDDPLRPSSFDFQSPQQQEEGEIVDELPDGFAPVPSAPLPQEPPPTEVVVDQLPEGFKPLEEKLPESEKLLEKPAEVVDELPEGFMAYGGGLDEGPLAGLPDFWKKIQTRYATGREQAVDDQLAYKAAAGEVKWEDVKDRLEPSIDATKAKGEHWYSEGLLQAAEMVPAMLDSWREGAYQGLGWSAVAGATTAATGVEPAVPITAGVAYGAGQTYGTYEYWRRQGTGSLYNDLRKEGVPHNVAQAVSVGFGIPYAGIEFLQMAKLVPGMKESVAHAVAGGVKKRMLALANEKGIEYVEQIGQETSQEVMQAASEAIAEWKSGVKPPPEKRGIWDRAWDTIKATAASMPFLMAPKVVTDARRILTDPTATPVVPGAVASDTGVVPPDTVVPPGFVPPPGVVPPTGAVPGVTIVPAGTGEVPGAPTGDEQFAPPEQQQPPGFVPGQSVEGQNGVSGRVVHTQDDGRVLVDFGEPGKTEPKLAVVDPGQLKQPIGPEVAGATVATKVQSDNEKVTQIADQHTETLQAAGAPATAQAIQQVAQRSNTEASVTAEQFLEQAQHAAANEQALQPAMAPITPVVPVGDERFAPPAPAAAALAEAPTRAPETSHQPAVVVGGQVFTGNTPADAALAAHDAVGPDAMTTASTGWVDPQSGRFVSHELYDAHQAFNTAVEQAGGDTEHPSVRQAVAQLEVAQARDTDINNQVIQPGGEQVVNPGIKGNEALISVRPSQELTQPLAGVTVTVEGVDAEGNRTTAERPAAQALNEARNDKTALTILLDCLH